MDRRIGAQFYTLREHIGTIEGFEETCRRVSEIGYKVVQISGTSLAAAEMRPILDRYGLETVVTHRAYEDFVNHIEEIIEYNRTLGCTLCGIGMMPFSYSKSSEGVTEFIKGMNRAADALEKEGLYLGYHNHALEFAKQDGVFIMDRLIRETDPDRVRFIADTYWIQVGGMDPAGFIERLGERVMAVHFKDLKANADNTTEMAEVGEGSLDWDGIIKACDTAGVRWALVEQDTCRRDPFESMKMSYEFLQTKGFR